MNCIRTRSTPTCAGAADAADLVQGFFAKLLDDSLLAKADPQKGRFRSYLLGALKHYLNDEYDRSHARKRGGGMTHVSLACAEQRYGLEPADDVTPEQLYERNWALTVLDRALERLRHEAMQLGKGSQFDRLKELIPGPLPDLSYADVAQELGTTEGALKVALHRLRARYRAVLTEQIAQTVESPQDVDEEIRHLFLAVKGR
ncbi:MAG: sigma-70 family RNA polymerase sigma factor [Planctomycetota bacterium]|nr:sigma-70 family RNA polymerase sigma factor [Planctomycetota bacterium]